MVATVELELHACKIAFYVSKAQVGSIAQNVMFTKFFNSIFNNPILPIPSQRGLTHLRARNFISGPGFRQCTITISNQKSKRSVPALFKNLYFAKGENCSGHLR